MKKILVLGGTRFFGKRLVELLVEDGHDVTIATRGNLTNPFGHKVRQVTVDRLNEEALKSAVGNEEWDIVYDNICYSPDDAAAACVIFDHKVGHYVFTSTLSVYPADGVAKIEADFDSYDYPIQMGNRDAFSYGEGKRLAEAVFFQKATFPVAAVRFPIVIGEEDYTERLLFHVEHVKNGEEIGMVNTKARMSFISSDEAGSFLRWVGQEKITGPINATLKGTYTLAKMLEMIERIVGKKAIIATEVEQSNVSPYNIPDSWYMDTSKAETAGYTFATLDSSFPQLVHKLA
ncbi:NAD-dependent epimerase/dehydratase family protein [Viridibacillus sp. YIM B01967]|uniref:UDP-glucose 4-epimerase n=1 Tax=Viridibacillus soli TaxID=2798301 RepID=A0ABS1H6G6_9BACL|nr:NAD-dependent epimerase/dehydratase family protein [Viridibacillus soli]MBK3494643.1 NAD-dependent epimerase/dehydratase family protein [Viridibacillus soli]